MAEVNFTVNTTEDFFTEFMADTTKDRDKFVHAGIAKSGDRFLMLVGPTWGQPKYKSPSHVFGVFGEYTHLEPHGNTIFAYYNDRPFIVFDFNPISSDRLRVTMEWSVFEPLVVLYANRLQKFIEDAYPECKLNEGIRPQQKENDKVSHQKLPTPIEVDTAVGHALSWLDERKYTVKRETRGVDIYYRVYKGDVWIGTYRIKPGKPGGSIQCTDDPELSDEWISKIIYQLIYPHLERCFGPFDEWDEPKESETQLPGLSIGNITEKFIQDVAFNTTGKLVPGEFDHLPQEQKKTAEEAKRFRIMRGVEHTDTEIESNPINPWDKIGNHNWDRAAIKMWWEGYTNSDIGKRVNVSKRRVTNRISELRQIYGTDIVPKDTERKKYLREKTRDKT